MSDKVLANDGVPGYLLTVPERKAAVLAKSGWRPATEEELAAQAVEIVDRSVEEGGFVVMGEPLPAQAEAEVPEVTQIEEPEVPQLREEDTSKRDVPRK